MFQLFFTVHLLHHAHWHKRIIKPQCQSTNDAQYCAPHVISSQQETVRRWQYYNYYALTFTARLNTGTNQTSLGNQSTKYQKAEVPRFLRERQKIGSVNCPPSCQDGSREEDSGEAWRGYSIAEANNWQWGSCPEDRNRNKNKGNEGRAQWAVCGSP